MVFLRKLHFDFENGNFPGSEFRTLNSRWHIQNNKFDRCAYVVLGISSQNEKGVFKQFRYHTKKHFHFLLRSERYSIALTTFSVLYSQHFISTFFYFFFIWMYFSFETRQKKWKKQKPRTRDNDRIVSIWIREEGSMCSPFFFYMIPFSRNEKAPHKN